MSIHINAKTDYSALFTGSSRNNVINTTASLASDYASIKNGSYGKVLKAYYDKTPNAKSSAWVKNNVNVADSKNLASVKSSSVDLKQNISVINNKLIDSGDKEKLTKTVKEFADSYNSLIKSAADSGNSSVNKQVKSMTNNTYINSDVLSNAGITVNKDNTLSVDEKKLAEASASTLKNVFTNKGSFGDNTSTKASMIYNSANSALNAGGMYNNQAAFNNAGLGSLFETYN